MFKHTNLLELMMILITTPDYLTVMSFIYISMATCAAREYWTLGWLLIFILSYLYDGLITFRIWVKNISIIVIIKPLTFWLTIWATWWYISFYSLVSLYLRLIIWIIFICFISFMLIFILTIEYLGTHIKI